MSPPGSRPVAITGYGAVGAFGAGADAIEAAFSGGGPRLTEVDRSAGYHRPGGARHAALVDPACLGPWLTPRQARRMSPPSRFAVVAAELALADAGLGRDEVRGSTAVVTSTAFGPSSYTEELLRQIFLDQPTAASPFLFTEAVANAPAAQIALVFGARGPNLTVTQREAGPLIALAHGVREVAFGRAERAIVASVDEANPLLHAVLDRFGALAGSRRIAHGPTTGGAPGSATAPEVARPFDRRRRGFVLGEGATAVLIEALGPALERGATPIARPAAFTSAFDPSAPRAGYGHGADLLAARLGRDLRRQGQDPAALGLVISGASGSPSGDALEAQVFGALFGRSALPDVLVPKATTGEQGGGLLAGALHAFAGTVWGPTPGFEEADPQLGLVPWSGGSVPRADRVLVSALAVGGSAAWMVLERGECV
ncbi:MAG: hypothetical protein MI919_29455 [Holophagales bacterium]|nr:hypothetical protein [Holophagales bacterium]